MLKITTLIYYFSVVAQTTEYSSTRVQVRTVISLEGFGTIDHGATHVKIKLMIKTQYIYTGNMTLASLELLRRGEDSKIGPIC